MTFTEVLALPLNILLLPRESRARRLMNLLQRCLDQGLLREFILYKQDLNSRRTSCCPQSSLAFGKHSSRRLHLCIRKIGKNMQKFNLLLNRYGCPQADQLMR